MLSPLIADRETRFGRMNCNGTWHGSHMSDIRNPTSAHDCSVSCPRLARSDHLVETTWAKSSVRGPGGACCLCGTALDQAPGLASHVGHPGQRHSSVGRVRSDSREKEHGG